MVCLDPQKSLLSNIRHLDQSPHFVGDLKKVPAYEKSSYYPYLWQEELLTPTLVPTNLSRSPLVSAPSVSAQKAPFSHSHFTLKIFLLWPLLFFQESTSVVLNKLFLLTPMEQFF